MTETKQDSEEKPSRTALKREALAAQSLGAELTKLRQDIIKRIPMSATLEKAILDHQGIRSNGAKKRQLQYIGRLMRDDDLDAIRDALSDIKQSSASALYQHHQLEAWRDKLLLDPKALTEYLDHHPDTDIQQLRVLIRQAKKEENANLEKTTSSAGDKKPLRALFRFLRDNDNTESSDIQD